MEDADAEIIWLFAEAGRFRQGINGPERITPVDAAQWSSVLALDLSPSEVDMIADMSAAWCAGLKADKAPHDPVGCKIAIASAEAEASYDDG